MNDDCKWASALLCFSLVIGVFNIYSVIDQLQTHQTQRKSSRAKTSIQRGRRDRALWKGKQIKEQTQPPRLSWFVSRLLFKQTRAVVPPGECSPALSASSVPSTRTTWKLTWRVASTRTTSSSCPANCPSQRPNSYRWLPSLPLNSACMFQEMRVMWLWIPVFVFFKGVFAKQV